MSPYCLRNQRSAVQNSTQGSTSVFKICKFRRRNNRPLNMHCAPALMRTVKAHIALSLIMVRMTTQRDFFGQKKYGEDENQPKWQLFFHCLHHFGLVEILEFLAWKLCLFRTRLIIRTKVCFRKNLMDVLTLDEFDKCLNS